MRVGGGKKPLVSAIIAAEAGVDISPTLSALASCGYPKARLEAWVARGSRPSRQRNLAARRAGGQFLLFLDSDSRAAPGLVDALLQAFDSPAVAAAGGPNLPLLPQSRFQSTVSTVLASWFGSLSVRARYRALGKLRDSGEKELILCNLMVRRRDFLAVGGFREDLYPNEENEFLNRLRAAGRRLRYQPSARVFRPRRDSLAAFARQAFRYGRGRMQQTRANFFVSDLVHGLPFACLAAAGAAALTRPSLLAWPLAAYTLADLAFSLAAGLAAGSLWTATACLALFPLRQAAYGLGWACGLFQPGRPRGASRVDLRKAVLG